MLYLINFFNIQIYINLFFYYLFKHKIASLREQLEAELEALQLDYSQRKDAYILSHTNSNATVTSKVCDKHNDENENENENEAEDMNDENNECIQNNSDVHNEC